MDITERAGLDPVVKQVTVPGDPGAVFDLFTARMGEWWPLASHSVAAEEAVGVYVEPGVGGRIYEVVSDGTTHEWGWVTAWAPGERVAFAWHPGNEADQATRVDITFRAGGEGTEVRLVHDGWEARGDAAGRMREGYRTGWDYVLSRLPGAILTT